MFQNISEEVEDGKIRTSINLKHILKTLFKFQNIIVYILTFLMSTLTIKQEIMPFGIAMVGACIGSTIPIFGVYISSLIGTYIGGGDSAVSNFLAITLVYIALVLVFKPKIAVEERNEVLKTGSKLFWACIIVEFFKEIKGIFLFYDFFMAIIAAAIIYVFYKIFVNGLITIKEFRIKKAFTIEELMATIIIISIASLAFNELNIFSLNISNIIIIFMIMLLGWKNGMMVGATCGIATGLAVSFADGTSFIQIVMFAVSGILSGVLNKFGKIGVIIGFVLGNAILTYITSGNALVISYFREIFIASVGLLLVPNTIKLTVEDLIGKTKLLSNVGETRLNESSSEITEKLKVVSDLFYEIMNPKTNEVGPLQEEFIQEFLDNLEEIDTNIFYEEISKEENGIVSDIYSCIQKNEVIVDKDLISILTNHNNYIFMQDENIKNDLQEIVKIANRTHKMIQINIAKEQERNKNLNMISKNLKEVSKVIENCAQEIKDNSENEFAKKEKEIELLFKNKKITIKKCFIKQLKNKKYIIKLEVPNDNIKIKEKETIANISDMISKSIGAKIVFQREKNATEDTFFQVYANEDKFIMQVGSSKISKEGNQISGDCNLQMRLDDGKYLLAIADGMGTGENARESSKLVIKLIKKLMSSGFEREESLKLINSTLNLNMNRETYSSVDMAVVDLYTGKSEFIKSAACSTYIKNKKNIRKISAESLPIGIVDKINLKTETVEVNDGDIVLMCSDGITESKDEMKTDWVEEFLRNVSTNNVQKLSDLLLAEAIDNSYGIAHDDMTVIACKIVKKK